MRKKIGECLVQAGLITEENLQSALQENKRTGERLGAVLIRMNLASEKQITKALAYQLGFPYVSLADDPPDSSVMPLIPKDVALKRVCVAVKLEKNLLTVAMSDPLLFSLVRDLEFQTGHRIKQVVTTRTEILQALAAGYPDRALVARPSAADTPNRPSAAPATPSAAPRVGRSEPSATKVTVPGYQQPPSPVFEQQAEAGDREATGPIIDLVNSLVQGALERQASDVHIEPMDHGVLVRHRLDGILRPMVEFPKWALEGVVARLKVLSGMDIAESGYLRTAGSASRPATATTSISGSRHSDRSTARRSSCVYWTTGRVPLRSRSLASLPRRWMSCDIFSGTSTA